MLCFDSGTLVTDLDQWMEVCCVCTGFRIIIMVSVYYCEK